jgi:Inositol 1,3,4-trisphosphate 5/6-kinase ATP-grasp domain
MKIYLKPYSIDSQSAKLLSEETGWKRLRSEGSRFIGGPNKVIINYGKSETSEQTCRCKIVNSYEDVSVCSNKKLFFERIFANSAAAPFIPPFTSSFDTAKEWMLNKAIVVARATLSGHSAEGLSIMQPDDISSWSTGCPLYTRYIPKKDEYRVHIVGGEIIDVQRKALKPVEGPENAQERPQVNWRVRNLANGFVYARQDVALPEAVKVAALAVANVSGLDFGAYDVIYNKKDDKAYVLEVNTAPGLAGTTVKNYAAALLAFIQKVYP